MNNELSQEQVGLVGLYTSRGSSNVISDLPNIGKDPSANSEMKKNLVALDHARLSQEIVNSLNLSSRLSRYEQSVKDLIHPDQ